MGANKFGALVVAVGVLWCAAWGEMVALAILRELSTKDGFPALAGTCAIVIPLASHLCFGLVGAILASGRRVSWISALAAC